MIAFAKDIFERFVLELTALVIAIILMTIFRKSLLPKLTQFWRWLTTSRRNAKKLTRAREAVESREGLWLAIPLKSSNRISNDAPNGYDVTTIANLKGGVGKTTLAVNLIGHCAVNRTQPGQSILGIDFDYQGSMTSMALPNKDQYAADRDDTRAGQLISGILKGDKFESAGIPHATEPRAKFIPSDYPFAQVENRLMVKWLLNDVEDDLRIRLTNQFSDLFSGNSPFDKIIIDAPPRLTTGAMQALCASSHIIIPTVMDLLSTEAVGQFITQIDDLRRNEFCPYLNKITVVGTIVNLRSNDEKEEHKFLCQAMQQGRCTDLISVVPFELSVLDKPELTRQAGRQVAYLDEHNNENLREIRGIFDKLGNHIWGS